VDMGIELGTFEEEERGGLITFSGSLLKALATGYNYSQPYDEEHHQLVDETFLAVLKKLRQKGLFRKEDIQNYNLIFELCYEQNIPEQRFRYLVDWDPSCLIVPGHSKPALPIHYVTRISEDIRGFRTIFEEGIRHFPKEMGGLFHKAAFDGVTAYQTTCEKYGKEEVDKIVNDTLENQENRSITTIESLTYAATKETVHLDCVYFLLRRCPAIVSVSTAPSPLAKRRIDNDRTSNSETEGTTMTLSMAMAMTTIA